MGVEHLQGKRTGRRPGSKSAAPWVRDVRWAYRNLGKPDAEPPSALAGLLVALGRQHPDRLLACLATLDDTGQRGDQAGGHGEPTDKEPREGLRAPRVGSEGSPGRVKTLRLAEAQLVAYLTGRKYPRIKNLPPGLEIVACEREVGGKVVVLTIRSEVFPLVEEGETVPELEVEFDYAGS
jgi:hypothetical protein